MTEKNVDNKKKYVLRGVGTERPCVTSWIFDFSIFDLILWVFHDFLVFFDFSTYFHIFFKFYHIFDDISQFHIYEINIPK